MYLPASFREDRVDVLHALIAEVRLGTLVTTGAAGLIASHVPMLIDPEPAPYGTLIGHLARANPQADDLAAGAALAIFVGPDAYVSPSFYPSKQATGEVVPTWNYAAVHAYGTPRVIDDPAGLLAIVTRLTEREEQGRAAPWQVGDAPAPYLDKMLRAIVGFAIPIARLEGKWKLSQNRSPADHDGVVAGLAADPRPDRQAVATLMQSRPRGPR